MSDTDCIFCAIATGAVPVEVVDSTDNVIAFRDMSPKAAVHILIVPREHHRDVVALAAANPDLLAEMAVFAGRIAEVHSGGDFRWTFNTGLGAGQTVFHVHGHLLGGADLAWENL